MPRDLPALDAEDRNHRVPSMVPVLPRNTETDQTGVGRLHYSLRLTLSAHFRRGICASDIDNAS
jgi:hypothetical protein